MPAPAARYRIGLLLFSDFDFVVFQVPVIPVDDVGGDVIELIVLNAVVGGFFVKYEFLRLAGFFVQIKRLLFRCDGIAFYSDE